MPYRRLPTTDQARKRALSTAIELGDKLEPSELAFSRHLLARIKNFSQDFEGALQQYKFNIEKQAEKEKEVYELQEKARMYVSHFMQVLNLTIIRGEFEPEVREFYGMAGTGGNLPSLNNEIEILEWGEKVIEGELKRLEKGGSPIYNPSIAMVKIHFNAFKEAVAVQKIMSERMAVYLHNINQVRENADLLIEELWNEIEEKYGHLPPKHKRQIAEEYGVVYIIRKKEPKRADELQRDLLFEF